MPDNNDPNNEESKFSQSRWEMVEKQLSSRAIGDSKVLKAFLDVPRHKFVPNESIHAAYSDSPLPIGFAQTISQPYIAALMTELLNIDTGDKVLEVGTGSGYQAAILAEMGCEVFTIEIIEELGLRTKDLLKTLGYASVHCKIGNGYDGWPEHAPFDAVIVTAAPNQIPQALIRQLKRGGKMVIPVGGINQDLLLIAKSEKGVDIKTITPVRFVPMTGESHDGEIG